jgi:hypothetical protein
MALNRTGRGAESIYGACLSCFHLWTGESYGSHFIDGLNRGR